MLPRPVCPKDLNLAYRKKKTNRNQRKMKKCKHERDEKKKHVVQHDRKRNERRIVDSVALYKRRVSPRFPMIYERPFASSAVKMIGRLSTRLLFFACYYGLLLTSNTVCIFYNMYISK